MYEIILYIIYGLIIGFTVLIKQMSWKNMNYPNKLHKLNFNKLNLSPE